MGQAESKLHLSPKYFLLPRFPLLPGQLLTLVPKALAMIYGVLVFGQAALFSLPCDTLQPALSEMRMSRKPFRNPFLNFCTMKAALRIWAFCALLRTWYVEKTKGKKLDFI